MTRRRIRKPRDGQSAFHDVLMVLVIIMMGAMNQQASASKDPAATVVPLTEGLGQADLRLTIGAEGQLSAEDGTPVDLDDIAATAGTPAPLVGIVVPAGVALDSVSASVDHLLRAGARIQFEIKRPQ